MKKRAFIGVDIGGTKTLSVLVDHKFRMIDEFKFKTRPTESEQYFTDNLQYALKQLIRSAKRNRLKIGGVGAGCAGQINEKRLTLEHSANIPHLKDYPLGKIIQAQTGREPIVGNDVQLGLYGEQQLGAAKGLANVLGVFFGTGVNGALIIDGKLFRGASGDAGQVGCLLTDSSGRMAGSDRHGILDHLASKASIAGEALGIAAKHWAPHLFKIAGTDLTKVTWGSLAKAINHGDRKVEELIRTRLRIVGLTLSNVVNFISPEMVVLGGGMAESMSKLVLKEIKEGLKDGLTPSVTKTCSVKLAGLKTRAVAIGAAKLASETARR